MSTIQINVALNGSHVFRIENLEPRVQGITLETHALAIADRLRKGFPSSEGYALSAQIVTPQTGRRIDVSEGCVSKYVSDNPLFRDLSEREVSEFKQWAHDNYLPDEEISTVWHPVIQAECALITKEQKNA